MQPSSKPNRTSDGCWTCRLRKKKCDLGQPTCVSCASLEIECMYSDAKPQWMDGGELQRGRAEQVKAEVKRRATLRREKRHVVGDMDGETMIDLEMADGLDGVHLSARAARLNGDVGSARAFATSERSGAIDGDSFDAATDTPPSSSWTTEHSPDSSATGVSPASSRDHHHHHHDGPAAEVGTVLPNSRELMQVMAYLDYVFPFLYPFYRPPIFSGGRGWLLTLLMSNKALLHASLTLVSFFLAVWFHQDGHSDGHSDGRTGDGKNDGGGSSSGAPADPGGRGRHVRTCQAAAWTEMQTQQELSMRSLMKDIADINEHGVKGRLREGSRTLASIIQILCFEVAVGNATGSWSLHLDGAIVLLDQMLQLNARSLRGPAGDTMVCWRSLMVALDLEDGGEGRMSSWLLSSDQAALQFFSAAAIYFDIVSSTALEQAPRLAGYHPSLLATPSEHLAAASPLVPAELVMEHAGPRALAEDLPPVDLGVVSGAANWVLVCVGKTAGLDAWKKAERRHARLDVIELVTRAGVIERKLRRGLEKMDAAASGRRRQGGQEVCVKDAAGNKLPSYTPPPPPILSNCPSHGPPDEDTHGLTTRIWAHAALAYLAVVVNGWQPASGMIRASVDAALSLLSALSASRPFCLQTVGWPLAVAGCLAAREQEQRFRALLEGVRSSLEVFGAVREALGVMEGVWARRGEIEGAAVEWDLSRCFGINGRRAFLV
ncbi:hypothetical protein PpBr36_00639 [Pyricularia pennisetigena]|uniref:hypothetical protein n=1 Tax=Pyricularia pennisetigena TaxID=1578925 RepID=UPI0011544E49|nr:hypothetical protein PpBr36_00639 [Pyricularia pennisetigena]TLS28725.1 hypothetical protein PpBr36_00639 [Pyricularia pennisetigena]